MEIIKTKKELVDALLGSTLRRGFVPTMGALHEGHVSLIDASKAENDLTIASIFVNPTQFTNAKDLELYPRPLESDLKILQDHGVDLAFIPNVEDIYSESLPWHMDLLGMDLVFEGKSRSGHFQGVTQIVKILFDLVGPQRAYFGQKDFQQILVIKKLVEQFRLPIEIISCPIVRDPDGLAMSSRNIRLSSQERTVAPKIYEALESMEFIGKRIDPENLIKHAFYKLGRTPLIKIDYLDVVRASDLQKITSWIPGELAIALIAVKLGETRLIDNTFIY